MPFPFAAAAIGVSALLGATSGGSSASQQNELPQWLKDLLLQELDRSGGQNGFLPAQEEFQAVFDARAQQAQDTLGFNVENFNANAASRNVFSSGEGLTQLYRQVYQPALNNLQTLGANLNLAYSAQYQQGRIASEEMRQRILELLTGGFTGQTAQQGGNFLGDIAGAGTNIGLLYGSGFFSGNQVAPQNNFQYEPSSNIPAPQPPPRVWY